ncbi:HPP family protein [Natrinema caseinilyticum]|uniref:HPP family protein n=1 Tax=Natrinema caseinilyticum TaxID=2961570 RepID=UPI0020C52E67|nr:HPP family protein [Natrinema caseinilyticum]
MLESLRGRYYSIRRRARRLKRRELKSLRRWFEDTENLLHLSALIVIPLLIGSITWLSNASPIISFFVYPPLASGTYTLFADPDGRYSTPRKFVGGMTTGALCGWFALELTARFLYVVPPEQFRVHAGAAALGILLTGLSTWMLEFEEPTAFSTALLILVTGSEKLTYVVGIVVSSILVASIFVVWRRHFYCERSRYLFQSTSGDDKVLVPVRGDGTVSLALFAARLAAAHEMGKVVLMQTVSEDAIQETADRIGSTASPTESDGSEGQTHDSTSKAEEQITDRALQRFDRLSERITSEVDVPCEYVVAVDTGSTGKTILQTAGTENCDLICAPYETDEAAPAQFVRTLISGTIDTVVFRPSNGRTEWHRLLVMVRSSGQLANTMLEFAKRLVSDGGTISASSCISNHGERRATEILLENVVESLSVPVETRIGHGSVEEFLTRNASHYDVAIVGASTDRSAPSRFISSPTYERIYELECDLAIVHRG